MSTLSVTRPASTKTVSPRAEARRWPYSIVRYPDLPAESVYAPGGTRENSYVPSSSVSARRLPTADGRPASCVTATPPPDATGRLPDENHDPTRRTRAPPSARPPAPLTRPRIVPSVFASSSLAALAICGSRVSRGRDGTTVKSTAFCSSPAASVIGCARSRETPPG